MCTMLKGIFLKYFTNGNLIRNVTELPKNGVINTNNYSSTAQSG